MEAGLKVFWRRYFKLDWRFGLILLSAICVPRFILVLHANQTGNYSTIGMIMLISAIIPFIFLNKLGIRLIGIKGSKKVKQLLLAFISGVIISYLLFLLGDFLYGKSYENWYSYIGRSYNISSEISIQDKRIMFVIMALTGMTFSPIGE